MIFEGPFKLNPFYEKADIPILFYHFLTLNWREEDTFLQYIFFAIAFSIFFVKILILLLSQVEVFAHGYSPLLELFHS